MSKQSCKCKKSAECEECPEWIFTFADLVMLMMGFFVILWVLKPPAGKQGTSDAEARREAYQRLAELDATSRGDAASALLWHRSILENFPESKSSLRHVEQHLIGDGEHGAVGA